MYASWMLKIALILTGLSFMNCGSDNSFSSKKQGKAPGNSENLEANSLEDKNGEQSPADRAVAGSPRSSEQNGNETEAESGVASEAAKLEQFSDGEQVTASQDKVLQDRFLNDQVEAISEMCHAAALAGTLSSFSSNVFFPERRDCNFGQKDNLARKDRVITARSTETATLPFTINEDKKICKIDFNIPIQEMEFDDEIILNLNNFVLASSRDYSDSNVFKNKQLKKENGFVFYDWLTLRGMQNQGARTKTAPFCLGSKDSDPFAVATGEQSCNIPLTQNEGTMAIRFSDKVATELGLRIEQRFLNQKLPLELQLITTGDNDNGDCRHKDFRFSIKIHYLNL